MYCMKAHFISMVALEYKRLRFLKQIIYKYNK